MDITTTPLEDIPPIGSAKNRRASNIGAGCQAQSIRQSVFFELIQGKMTEFYIGSPKGNAVAYLSFL